MAFICKQHGFELLNYLDDFQGVESVGDAHEAFHFLQLCLSQLGLEESKSKACPPSTLVTCLGVQFDTVNMTVSVTPDRLKEISRLLDMWTHKVKATKRELQSLIGKLVFVSKCVRQSCIFLTRLLDLLRSLKYNHHHINVNAECSGG